MQGKRAKKKPPKKIKTMDVILVIVGIMLFSFTVTMIKTFRDYGAIPDTLVTCVFAALGGECGIMGWIKTTKDRNKERKWELDDREEAKEEADKAAQMPPETTDGNNDEPWI